MIPFNAPFFIEFVAIRIKGNFLTLGFSSVTDKIMIMDQWN